MPLLTLTGAGQTIPIVAFAQEMVEELRDLSALLKEVAEEIVLPAFGRHFEQSGLKSHSQVLKTAVTQPGAKGNVLEIRADGFTAGVSYAELPYAQWAFEGRGPVAAKRAKALRFLDDNGKPIFAKHVSAAPAHPVIYLTESEMEQIAARLTQRLVQRGAHPISK